MEKTVSRNGRSSGAHASRPPHNAPSQGAEWTIREVQTRVAEELDRLSRALMTNGAASRASGGAAPCHTGSDARQRAQERMRFLGQVAAGLAGIRAGALPREGAGFGSTVVVEEVDTRERHRYTLMTGAVLDLEAGHVSLESPMGQALLGVRTNACVEVDTPRGQRRFLVRSVATLQDVLDTDVLAAGHEPQEVAGGSSCATSAGQR